MRKTASTGVPILDRLLGGGLPRGRGYMIVGGSFSSKEIFCMQMQYASLQRGESCVYISFEKTFRRVCEDYEQYSWDITPHINKGTFGFMDYASVQFNAEADIRIGLSDEENRVVRFLKDPLDPDEYFNVHIELSAQVGYGGVVIIDSLSDQLLKAHSAGLSPDVIMNLHARCRQRFGEIGGYTGLHIFNNNVSRDKISEYGEFLNAREDGTIYLEDDMVPDHCKSPILCGHIKSAGIRIPSLYYEVRPDGFFVETNPRKDDPIEMNIHERAVIEMLATHFDHIEAIKSLWQNAGGKVGDIPDAPNSKVRWEALWRKAKAGAAVTTIGIVREGLADFPGNPALIQYLADIADIQEVDLARNIVNEFQLLPEKFSQADIIRIMEKIPERSSDVIFSSFAPAFNNRIKPSVRKRLLSVLKSVGKGTAEAGKATIEAAAKGITQALLASLGIPS
jgi:archaellum biogenesis ATPase FlaH